MESAAREPSHASRPRRPGQIIQTSYERLWFSSPSVITDKRWNSTANCWPLAPPPYAPAPPPRLPAPLEPLPPSLRRAACACWCFLANYCCESRLLLRVRRVGHEYLHPFTFSLCSLRPWQPKSWRSFREKDGPMLLLLFCFPQFRFLIVTINFFCSSSLGRSYPRLYPLGNCLSFSQLGQIR